jgi:hypothetical protein
MMTKSDYIVAALGYGESAFPAHQVPVADFEEETQEAANQLFMYVENFEVDWTAETLEDATTRLRLDLRPFDLTPKAVDALAWKFTYGWK